MSSWGVEKLLLMNHTLYMVINHLFLFLQMQTDTRNLMDYQRLDFAFGRNRGHVFFSRIRARIIEDPLTEKKVFVIIFFCGSPTETNRPNFVGGCRLQSCRWHVHALDAILSV